MKPLKIIGLSKMVFGNNIIVHAGAWIQTHDSGSLLEIGDGSILGHSNHIYAYGKITMGKKVLTADKVYISDCIHTYDNVGHPIMEQPIKALNPVSIGDNCWLGENVVVIGASIGKHCVIGANSVVNKDIPDYSVAVGSPARVIKKYNHSINIWEKV